MLGLYYVISLRPICLKKHLLFLFHTTHIKAFVFIDKYFYMCYYNTVRRKSYMKSYSSREVIQMLKADGWYEVNVVGSHHQFKHPTKKGRTTVKHPDSNIPVGTLKSIESQSGLRFN